MEKTRESPLDNKEIKPVNPKRNQPWIFIGRTDADSEGPRLWAPDGKSWLIGKDPDAGKNWRQEEKGAAEDELVGWYHRLSGHEFEQALGGGEGQGSLACCSPWDCKESDTNELLSNNKGGPYLSRTDVLIKRGKLDIDVLTGRHQVKMKAEVRRDGGWDWRTSEVAHKPTSRGEAWQWTSLQVLSRKVTCPHLDFWLPASRALRINVFNLE